MGTFNLDQTFIREYDRTWNFLYQQDTSFLRSTVRNEMQNAEKKAYTFIAPTQGIVDRARHSASPDIPTQHQRTWVTMHTWTYSELVEDIDIIKTLNDPSSAYLKNAVSSAHRFYDELILSAPYMVASRGKDGTTLTNWYDSGESIGIKGDGTLTTAGSGFTDTTETGLTLAKIATIGLTLDNNNVPANDRHLVANFDQKWYLLGSTKVGSYDYNSVKALTNGELGSYLGLNFHWLPSDRFTTDTTDTGCFDCAAYHKNAIVMTIGMDMKTRLTEESSSNYAVRVFAETMCGVARLQGPGVVPIALKKAPAADFSQTS